MNIRKQIEKFEKHKDFCQKELDWTEIQKEDIIGLCEGGAIDQNIHYTLKRAQERGFILHIKNVDNKKSKKQFLPNFFFFELGNELEQLEAEILTRKKIVEIATLEDLIWKVLKLYANTLEPILANLRLNDVDININHIETIQKRLYVGQNALEIIFSCPKRDNCKPDEKIDAEGLCPIKAIWKSLFKEVFKKIEPFIPKQKYTFRPQAEKNEVECSILIIYQEEKARGDLIAEI